MIVADFPRFIECESRFIEALSLVRAVSRKPVYLIGSAVYGGLAHLLHDVPYSPKDFDFIVDSMKRPVCSPAGYIISSNTFGNFKFIRDGLEVDVIPLEAIRLLNMRRLEPNINNYFTQVPLTVQAVAYDVANRVVLGEKGLKAVINRTVSVHNLEGALYYCKQKGLTLRDFIDKIAHNLGFNSVVPEGY